MAKLIHAASLADVKKSTLLYSSNAYTDSAKKSIIFTNDGYIVTLGHEYYIGTAAKGTGTTGTTITNGKIKVIDSLGNSLSGTDGVLLPVWKLSNGNVITVSNPNSGGDWTINHNLRAKTASDTTDVSASTNAISISGFDTSTYLITPRSLSFDKYGHISQTGTGTAIDVNKITDNVLTNSSTNKTIYILGSTSAALETTYYTPNKFGGLYATVGADNKVTLVVDKVDANTIEGAISVDDITGTLPVNHGGTGAATLSAGGILYGNGTSAIGASVGTAGQVLISGGTGAPTWRSVISTVDLTHTAATNNSLVTEAAVVDAVTKGFAANDAMVFKGTLGTGGTITSVPTNGYSAGATYRVITAGTYAGLKCEVGDLLIAVTDAAANLTAVNNNHWTVAQTNIDGAVTSENALTADYLVVGNGNLTVKTFGIGTEGLVLKTVKDGNTLKLQWSTDIPNRAVQVEGTLKLSSTATDALNFKAGTGLTASYDGGVKYSLTAISGLSAGSKGLYKIGYNTLGLITSAESWDPKTLTITSGNATISNAVAYDPDGTSQTIDFNNGLKAEWASNKYTVGHSTSVTAAGTNEGSIYKFTYDTYGHIAKTKEWDPDTITIWSGDTAVLLTNGASTNAKNIIYDPDGTSLAYHFLNGIKAEWDSTNSRVKIGHTNSITALNTQAIYPIKIDKHGHISAYGNAVSSLKNPYGIKFSGKNSSGTALDITYDGSTASYELAFGTNLTVTKADNVLTIAATNTWRDIRYYAISSGALDSTIDNYYTTNAMEPASAGTRPLKFGSNFTFDANDELDLVWAEVSTAGAITYSV